MILRALLPLFALAVSTVSVAAPPPPPAPEEVLSLKTFFKALPDQIPEQIQRFAALVSPDVKVYREGKLAFSNRDAWFAQLRSLAARDSRGPRGITVSREAFYRTADGGIAVLEFAYPLPPAGMEGQITYHPENPLQLVTYHLSRGLLVRVDYGQPMRSFDYLLREAAASSTANPDPAATAPSGEVVTRDRLTPQNAIRTMTAKCASNSYGIELRHDGSRNVLSLEVNGRRLAAAEIAKVEQGVAAGYFLYDLSVAECFRDRPNARMRLLTDGPNSGGTSRWISFEVTPEGRVSAVRED